MLMDLNSSCPQSLLKTTLSPPGYLWVHLSCENEPAAWDLFYTLDILPSFTPLILSIYAFLHSLISFYTLFYSLCSRSWNEFPFILVFVCFAIVDPFDQSLYLSNLSDLLMSTKSETWKQKNKEDKIYFNISEFIGRKTVQN